MTDNNDSNITPEQETELKALLGEGEGNIKMMTRWAHELFTEFKEAGFTEDQAFEMASKVTVDIMQNSSRIAMQQASQRELMAEVMKHMGHGGV